MTERLSCRSGVCGVCVECRRLLKRDAEVVDLDVAPPSRLSPIAQAILDEPRPKGPKRRVRPVQNRRKPKEIA